jgi:IS1 family transposase/transposase-like protein
VQTCRGFARLGPHPDHRIVGYGTYATRSGTRQLYRCAWCQTVFSETQGTVFFGLKTPEETIYRALACLAEGQGLRATARIFGVKPEDILRWLRRAGQHSERVSTYLMRNLHVEQAQLDELWTFVHKKEKRLSGWEQLHTDWGDTWLWTIFDPVSKLVLAFEVGARTETEAVGVLSRLKAVLVEALLPLFTSDQLPHYLQALLQVFGHWVQPARQGTRGRFPKPRLEPSADLQYATVHKERAGNRVVAVTTQVVLGQPEALWARLKALGVKKINTAFVERMNLTLRHLVSRLKRRGLNFSKRREDLVWHLHLSVAYYHFVLPHRSLRRRLTEPVPTRGTPKPWAQRTPAMAAGLTDHVWDMREFLRFRVPSVAA